MILANKPLRCWRVLMTGIAIATVVGALDGCKEPISQAERSATHDCIADSIGALRLLSSVPTCSAGSLTCRAKCQLGEGASCLGLGYAAQKDGKAESVVAQFYRQGCLLGVANACTNFAAGVWANNSSSDEELACAQRALEKACGAKEHFGCGMVGRMMLAAASPGDDEPRKYLEKTCEDVGGFSCRVLAKQLESRESAGDSSDRIRALLVRACEGGDPDACNEPKTASETFR